MKTCWWRFGHRWIRIGDTDFKAFDGRILKSPTWKCEKKCGLYRVQFPANEEGALVIIDKEDWMK